MRWAFLSLFLSVSLFSTSYGLTPIKNEHNSLQDIDDEFRNLYQPQTFTVVASTPNYNEFQEGQPVIASSGSIKLMIQVGTTVYYVNLSPVTGK